jgi:hypothetical protein
MKISIYDIQLVDDIDEMLCISLVENPAVEKPFIAFEKDKEKEISLFQTIEENEQHKILGVAIRCDVPIYRYDYRLGEYYVRFSKEVIEQIVEKYSTNNKWNFVSLHHSGELIQNAILTQVFIKDTEKGIDPKGFEDIENYSLFVEFKIVDNELWEKIKSNEVKGFSIEIISSIQPTNEFIDYDLIDELDELFDYLEFKKITRGDIKEILSGNRQVNLTIGDITLENQQIYELGKQNDKDSIVVFNPKSDDWNIYELDTINNIEITDNELENFNFNAKWKQIVENNDLVIITTKPTGQRDKNSLDYIFDRNLYVMLKYDDEKPMSATGFRTCFLSSWGYTTRGNECIRIYEYSGDTREGFDDGRWRLLLTRRIMDLKSVDYADPIKMPPPLYNGEKQHDTGRWGTMQDIKRIATFPPKIIE